MTIYNFYFFNREGVCICYKEWKREKQAGMSQEEEFKLMYGMLLSLRSFSTKLNTKDGQQLIRSFRTSVYKMNYLETPTGLKMVLNTDLSAGTIPELLKQIYRIYVDTVLRNPLIDGSKPIASEAFHSQLTDAVESHPCFA